MLSLQPVVPFEISDVRVYTMDFETTSHASQLSALGNTIQSGNRATHTNSKILKPTEPFETVQQRKKKKLDDFDTSGQIINISRQIKMLNKVLSI